MKMPWKLVVVVLFLSAHFALSQATPTTTDVVTVPTFIRFAGNVPAQSDVLGIQKLTFAIYENPEGGEALWSESDQVLVNKDGSYVVYLGSMSGEEGVPLSLFTSGKPRWVGVTTSAGNELPREPIASSAYAFQAANASTLGGMGPGDFVSVRQLSALFPSIVLPSSTAFVGQNVQASTSNLTTDGLAVPPPAFVTSNLPNVFEQQQTFAGGAKLSASVPDTNHKTSLDSAPLDFTTLFVQPQTGQALSQTFRWASQPSISASGAPSAQLGLSFGQGASLPQPTGFSINSDGTLNFASGQAFPPSAISAAIADSQNGGAGPNNANSGSPVVNTAGYEWTQTQAAHGWNKPIVVGSNTITLTPCPKGVNGTDLWHYLYISKTGTPESVLITGGSCVSGAVRGTVEFNAQYNHPTGYSIGSATDGVQEAIIDAVPPGETYQLARNVLIAPGPHLFYARLSIRATGLTINASGATITCEMNDTCIMMGDSLGSFQNITLNGLRVIAGVPNGTWPAVEDNANGSTISNLAPLNSTSGGTFGSLIQVDNDQAATIAGLTIFEYLWSRCDISFCSTAIVGPGKGNSGVIWVQNSNLSLNCTANGIDNQDGNTLHVSNTIVQAYPQFGIRSSSTYTNNPSVQIDSLYEEIGNCTNPRGTGMAGLIAENGYANVTASVGPIGQYPVFANSGATQYNYSIVVHSSTWGVSSAYFAGYAYTNGTGSIPVVWNQVGNTGTVTYDVLRTTGSTTIAPYGTGSFAVATGIPATSCVNAVCSFTDSAAVQPSSYTVSTYASYWPALTMWPGSVILTTSSDYENTGGGTPNYYFTDNLTSGVGIVNSAGGFEPSVFATVCDSATAPLSSIWIQCIGGNALSNDNSGVAATILQSAGNGGNPGGLKGRLIFEMPANSSLGATEIVTLGDSNPAKTMASVNSRATWDLNDTYFGFDQPTPISVNQLQLAFASPVSISNYIGSLPDNINWGERLTKSAKIFQVPVYSNSSLTVAGNLYLNGSCSGCGPFSLAGGVKDNFNESNGPLDSNWTVSAGTWDVVNGQATFTGDSSGTALAVYTASNFTSDQVATVQVIFSPNSASAVGPAVRMSPSSETGYVCFASPGLSMILKYDQGQRSMLGGIGPGISSGDYITAQVTGTTTATVTCLDNGVPIASVSGVDSSSPLTSGSPGVFGEFYSVTPYLRNFIAANLSYTTNIPISFAGGLQIMPQPFSVLSACASNSEGTQQPVIDSNTKSLGAAISSGGGPYHVLAYCDGSNWIVGTAAQ